MPTSSRTLRERRRKRRLRQQLKTSIKDHPDWPVVLSEGDSWFAYPNHRNLVDHLDDVGKMSLLRLEANGDEVVSILSGKQRVKLRKVLDQFRFDVLLFSGGGNDIVGQDFYPLLHQFDGQTSALACINTERAVERLALVRQMYVELIRLRDEAHETWERKKPGGKPKPLIVTHGYDRPVPRDKGYEIFGKKVLGPWLYGALKRRGIKRPFWNEIAAWFIDRFGDTQRGLATQFDRYAFVDTAGTLRRSGSGWKKDWSDEIHPSAEGFRKVGEKVRARLKEDWPSCF